MQTKRIIKIKDEQFIGSGDFSEVYRISKTKIVKIPYAFFNHLAEKLIRDEIRGSKIQKFALPILEIVNVIMPNKDMRLGMIKKYIPFEVSHEEILNLIKDNRFLKNSWDARHDNFRRDSHGKIWRIDTQTKNCTAWLGW